MSKPYNVSWEQHAKDLEEVNRRLSAQLSNINKMFLELYTTIKNHESRITALEP